LKLLFQLIKHQKYEGINVEKASDCLALLTWFIEKIIVFIGSRTIIDLPLIFLNNYYKNYSR